MKERVIIKEKEEFKQDCKGNAKGASICAQMVDLSSVSPSYLCLRISVLLRSEVATVYYLRLAFCTGSNKAVRLSKSIE
jgi:hypothetical protein